MRALNDGQSDQAVEFAKRAFDVDPEWHAPAILLANAKLQCLARVGWKTVDGPLVTDDKAAVVEVVQLFDRAVELAKKTNNYRTVADALLERARAKRILFASDVDADIAEAQNLAPDDATVLLRCGRHYLFTNRPSLALPALRKCQTLKPTAEVSFVLAMALRATDSLNNRSEWLALAKRAAADPDASPQLDAARLVVSTLCADRQLAEAKAFVAASGLPQIAGQCFLGWIAVSQKMSAEAAKLAEDAFTSLTDEAPIDIARLVAETLLKVGSIHHAVPILEKVATQTHQITDAWDAIDAAKRVRDVACIRRIGRNWRDAGILDPILLEAEVAVLEVFAPQEALTLLQELVVKAPDDRILRFRLGRLASDLDRPELIVRDVSLLPESDRVSAYVGAEVATYLSAIGDHAAAIRYAYDLLRHHQDEPSANAALAYAVIPAHPPEEVFGDATRIGFGSAFALLEEGADQPRWYVLKDYTTGPSFPEDIAPDHALAKRVIGLACHDRVLISGDELDGRYGAIQEIKSKFIYRAQKILNEWEIHSPDSYIQTIRLGKPEGEKELLDYTPLIRRTYERERRIDEKLQLYRDLPATVHMVAASLGKSDYETLCYLARTPDIGVRCCDGRVETFQSAIDAFRSASAIVMDITAIATLDLVNNLESLLHSPHEIVVTTRTLQEVRHLRDERREQREHSGYVSTSSTGIGIQLTELDPHQIENAWQRAQSILDSIVQRATCVDVPELIDLTIEDRDQAIETLGLPGAESALLASRPNHVLYTDDSAAAAWSGKLFGAVRVWTQPVLAGLAMDGHLSWTAFHRVTAKFVAFDYTGIQIDADTFFAAAEIAEWAPSGWPLRQCLTTLRNLQDARAAVLVAGRLIAMIFRKQLRRSSDGAVVMGVLDALADGTPGIPGVMILERQLGRLFGLDVLSRQEAHQVFSDWKSLRSL
jgi:tetratricopeptide (TPR) repeat protein